jgi:hypothetical protein
MASLTTPGGTAQTRSPPEPQFKSFASYQATRAVSSMYLECTCAYTNTHTRNRMAHAVMRTCVCVCTTYPRSHQSIQVNARVPVVQVTGAAAAHVWDSNWMETARPSQMTNCKSATLASSSGGRTTSRTHLPCAFLVLSTQTLKSFRVGSAASQRRCSIGASAQTSSTSVYAHLVRLNLQASNATFAKRRRA